MEKPLRILFIADGVATWLVKHFVNECVKEDERASPETETWLSIIQGVVLPEGMSPHRNLSYQDLLLKEWSVLHTMPSTIGIEGTHDGRPKRLELDGDNLQSLIKRLRNIDCTFTTNSSLAILRGKIWTQQPERVRITSLFNISTSQLESLG